MLSSNLENTLEAVTEEFRKIYRNHGLEGVAIAIGVIVAEVAEKAPDRAWESNRRVFVKLVVGP